MAKYKFTVSRRSVYNEVYEVECDSEEQLKEILEGDGPDFEKPLSVDWIDWYDDDWTEEDREDICPLYEMIKNKETEIASSA